MRLADFSESFFMITSEQELLNQINGSGEHSYSVQEVLNIQGGFSPHQYTPQESINVQSGKALHGDSFQQALFNNLKTTLSLTGNDTKYSEQELLTLAKANSLTLSGIVTGTFGTGVPYGLLISLTQP